MGSFGERLRREREMRGISLDEIVATTKIGRRLLTALEDEQFDLLPGGIFNKAYVRAYAKCVGINEDEAVAEYLQAANEVPPDTRVIAQQHASIHSNRPVQRSGFPIMPVFILLVVIAAGVGGWKLYQDHLKESDKGAVAVSSAASQSSSNAAAPASSGSGSKTAASSPQPTPATVNRGTTQAASIAASASSPAVERNSPTPGAGAPAGTSFELTVRPKDSAWVSIKSDGRYVVRGIIRPPDVKTIQATDQIVFYTGNAGAVEVSFNGKDVPLSGGPNTEQVLVFGSHGIVPAAAAGVQAKTSTQ